MAHRTEEQQLASRLCLACGMCCDGTVYGYALIGEAEIRQTEEIGLETTRTTDGIPAFNFPCRYLAGRVCQRYEDWRPSVCGDYFCRVQKRVGKQELSESEALARIEQAQKLRDQVLPLLPPGMPFSEARYHFKKLAADRENLGPDDAKMIVRMFVLERFLDSEFRHENAGHLPHARSDQESAAT